MTELAGLTEGLAFLKILQQRDLVFACGSAQFDESDVVTDTAVDLHGLLFIGRFRFEDREEGPI